MAKGKNSMKKADWIALVIENAKKNDGNVSVSMLAEITGKTPVHAANMIAETVRLLALRTGKSETTIRRKIRAVDKSTSTRLTEHDLADLAGSLVGDMFEDDEITVLDAQQERDIATL